MCSVIVTDKVIHYNAGSSHNQEVISSITKEILSDPGNEYSEEVVKCKDVKCKDIIKIKQLVRYVSLKKQQLFFVVGVKKTTTFFL